MDMSNAAVAEYLRENALTALSFACQRLQRVSVPLRDRQPVERGTGDLVASDDGYGYA